MYTRYLDWHGLMVSPDTDIVPELKNLALPERIIEHTTYYPPKELVEKLDSCRNVALVGMDTDACVYATALLLWDRGIRPLFPHDCCTSFRGPAFHRIGMEMIRRQFGSAAILDKVLPVNLTKNVMAAVTGPTP